MATKKLDWKRVNIVDKTLVKLLAASKDAAAVAKERRKAFEDALVAKARKDGKISDDETLAVAYRFGVAVAPVPLEEEAKQKKEKPADLEF